jgi:D-mannonate dehydratase
MGRLGIPVWCYAWMTDRNWVRTSTAIPARGGSTVTGFDGLMRSDHVPTLHGEVGAQAGYGVLGRLYAVGYIRGLIEGTAERR